MADIMFMSGAIMGDFYGSPYEFHPNKDEEYVYHTILKGGERNCKFTDDTFLTFAIMKWLSSPRVDKTTLIKILKDFVRRYPSSYGTHFAQWALSGSIHPYNSCGNGSAMRVSPVGIYANSLEECLELAKLSKMAAEEKASIAAYVKNHKPKSVIRISLCHTTLRNPNDRFGLKENLQKEN